jgi:inner membrane transporter RhtA
MSELEPSTSLPVAQKLRIRIGVAAMPPWLLVLLAVISVQAGAAVAKQLFDVTGPGGVVFLRTSLASVLFFALWRPAIRGYRPQDYLLITIYGITIAAMMLCFYAAIDRIPLGITVAIAFVGPLGIAVVGSQRRSDLVWVALAAGGIILLSPLTGVVLDPIGLLLAFLSAVGWAVFILLTGRVSRTFPASEGLAVAMAVAAVVSIPFGLVGAVKVLPSLSLVVLGVVVALLSSAIPFGFEFEALKRLPAPVYGVLTSLEPVVAVLVGFIVLHETLGLREIAGIVMVTVAAAATARASTQTPATV